MSEDCLFYFNGVFFEYETPMNRICFFYKKNDSIACVEFELEGSFFETSIYKTNFAVDAPAYWKLCFRDNNPFLFFNKSKAIDLKIKKIISTKDYFWDLDCIYNYEKECLYISEGSYSFGNYIIEHHNSFGYRCVDITNQKELWKIKLKGYLYSEIFEYNNLFIFCTAEHGGGLYGINRYSGKIEYYIDTNGTSRFIVKNSNLYCYKLGKVGSLLKIDLNNGNIIDECTLPGKVTIDCPLKLVKNSFILAMSFARGDTQSVKPVISCIEINC